MNDPSLLSARDKLDVGSYWRMVDAGIFGKEDHVELIDGGIVDMARIGQGHVAGLNSLNEALFSLVRDARSCPPGTRCI